MENKALHAGKTFIKMGFFESFEKKVIIIIIIIELTHSKTLLENTVEIEPQPVVLDFKNLSQYSSPSK